MQEKKLVRSTTNKMVAGVCAGLADYLNLDPTLVRVGMAALGFFTPVGLPLYVIMWIVVPEETTALANVNGSDSAPLG